MVMTSRSGAIIGLLRTATASFEAAAGSSRPSWLQALTTQALRSSDGASSSSSAAAACFSTSPDQQQQPPKQQQPQQQQQQRYKALCIQTADRMRTRTFEHTLPSDIVNLLAPWLGTTKLSEDKVRAEYRQEESPRFELTGWWVLFPDEESCNAAARGLSSGNVHLNGRLLRGTAARMEQMEYNTRLLSKDVRGSAVLVTCDRNASRDAIDEFFTAKNFELVGGRVEMVAGRAHSNRLAIVFFSDPSEAYGAVRATQNQQLNGKPLSLRVLY